MGSPWSGGGRTDPVRASRGKIGRRKHPGVGGDLRNDLASGLRDIAILDARINRIYWTLVQRLEDSRSERRCWSERVVTARRWLRRWKALTSGGISANSSGTRQRNTGEFSAENLAE